MKIWLKIAYRNLVKHKGNAAINILGLVLGFTVCLLIFQYVAYERSYDKHIQQADRVFRLRLDLYRQGTLAWQSATVFPGIAPAMKEEIPEVESVARLLNVHATIINKEREIKHHDIKTFYADSAFPAIYGIKMQQSAGSKILDAPGQILLSSSSAKIYFGDAPPLGKTLQFKSPTFEKDLVVTGVFDDLPSNAHLKINQIISYPTLVSIKREEGDTANTVETSWGWYDFFTYFKLKPQSDIATVKPKLEGLCNKYYNSGERQRKNNLRVELHTIPVTDIHLHSKFYQEADVNGDGKTVSFLFLISFLIISIAWINYINLTTAKFLERAREVGIRKVMGASRLSLIKQFLVETLLVNLVALAIAVLFCYLLNPLFRQFTGIPGTSLRILAPYLVLFLVIFVAGTFLSGLYPAFVLSNLKPVKMLKGIFKNSKSGILLRKGLIIWQFAIAIILITTTIVIYQQVRYMRNKKLGANIEQTLIVDGSTTVKDSLYRSAYQSFKSDFMKIPGVKSITASSDIMGREIYTANLNNRIGSNNQVTLYNIYTDYDFIPSYNLELLGGRNFAKDFSDTRAAIINEEALKLLEMGSPEAALNQKFVSNNDTVTLIGILANYHHEGLQKKIPPVILRLRPEVMNFYSVKIETANIKSIVGNMEGVWKNYFSSDPFNYYFLDDLFAKQYKADERFGNVFNLFSLLAILISCIGILGLTAFSVVQRTKEIGIRKVLGASVAQLVFLFFREYLAIIFIAMLIAVPVAWWAAHKWLENFAYKINVGPALFVVSGIVMTIIAFITVWAQALKTITTNPQKNLRSE